MDRAEFPKAELERVMRLGLEGYLRRDTGGPRDAHTMDDGWRAMTAADGATPLVYRAQDELTSVLCKARRKIGTNINTPRSRWDPDGFKREARLAMDDWARVGATSEAGAETRTNGRT